MYAYDFGDTAGITPLLKMHTLGHDFVPDPIHAGGLRYHGMSPLLSHVYELGLVRGGGQAAAGVLRGRADLRPVRGDHPGAGADRTRWPPSSRRPSAARRSGEQKVILTALCGHGHLDMAAYERYLSGEMVDYELSQERIDDALTRLPAV